MVQYRQDFTARDHDPKLVFALAQLVMPISALSWNVAESGYEVLFCLFLLWRPWQALWPHIQFPPNIYYTGESSFLADISRCRREAMGRRSGLER